MNRDPEKSPEFLQGYHYAQKPSVLARTLQTGGDLNDLVEVFENYPGPCAEIARGMAAYYREYAARRASAATPAPVKPPEK